MNMVFNTIDNKSLAPGILDKISNNTEELRPPAFVNYSSPELYGKYSLDMDLMVTISHKW